MEQEAPIHIVTQNILMFFSQPNPPIASKHEMLSIEFNRNANSVIIRRDTVAACKTKCSVS